jgi:hypothetical protein
MLPRLALLGLLLQMRAAESITGVLYSESEPASASSKIFVEIASGGKVYGMRMRAKTLGSWLETDPSCREIGSRWTISFVRQSKQLEMRSVRCAGSDPILHSAWLVARDHLERQAGRLPIESEPISQRWRSAAARASYIKETADWDFRAYAKYGRRGRCLSIARATASVVEFNAGIECYLEGPYLRLRVVKNPKTGAMELDNITLIDSRTSKPIPLPR